jgi:hypothetical protein
MQLKPSREQIETMVAELAQRPELFARLEGLLKQVRSEKGEGLDEVEELVVEQVRGLGQEILSEWLHARAVSEAGPAGARRGGKKNCGA